MQKLRPLVLLALAATMSLFARAQKNNETIRQYIDKYKDLAMAEMQRTGVPASIKLAQGIHETMAGTSKLVQKSNNHFGIKCKSNWTGESVSHDDDARGECFRKYPTAEDSYRDHSDFLKNSSRYASLFDLDPTDYAGWANGLKKAGYATNPKYPEMLIKMVEDYQLNDYTLIALGKMPGKENKDVAVLVQKEESQPAQPVNAVVVQKEEPVAPPVIYPEGEFKINDTKVVFVKKGTSYLGIAQQYNVDLSKLFDFNEMTATETVAADQLLYIQRKRKTGKGEFHIVKPGETLHGIAQEEGIRLESLLEYNFLRENMQPASGERLSLRSKAPTQPRLASR
jgi:LysM repeat protein